MQVFLALIFATSVAGTALAFFLPRALDLLLLAGPMAIASALLWFWSWRKQRRTPDPHPAAPKAKALILDGSNVMYWRDNRPRLETVIELVNLLTAKGYQVGIMFDANAGHILLGRYLDDRHFAALLNLPQTQCFVVPKGTVADEYILRAARDHAARIVTNDRYRDWAGDFPEVTKPGHLIKGRIEKGAIRLHRLAPPA